MNTTGSLRCVLCIIFAAVFPPAFAQDAAPPDAAALQRGMAAVVAGLDAYAKSMDTGELIVSLHRQVHGRPPTAAEFLILESTANACAATPEEVLSLVLRGEEPGPTWDQCRNFLDGVREKGLVPLPGAKALAAELNAADPREILREMADAEEWDSAPPPVEPPSAKAVPPVEYSTYFGYFHDHSGLSLDAVGDPFEAYRMARDEAGLDFYSLTDHAEFLILWPWDNKWRTLRAAAEEAYEPGVFAALWGFEWSNPVLGHVNVMNSRGFVSAVDHFWLGGFYRWLSCQTEAFAQFNHPGDYNDLNTEYYHFRFHAGAAQNLAGMELWNSDASLDHYHYSGSWDNGTGFIDRANLKGWRIAPAGGQDNHRENWGLRNPYRVGVQAGELTREGIAEAFLARRFYTTEDRDLFLDFRSSGHPMGSRLAELPRVFNVSARDGGGDTFQEVRLYRNGELLQSVAVSGDTFEITLADPDGGGDDYYYVIVTQTDDWDGNGRNDEAVSAPIWFFDAPPPARPACGALAGTNGAAPGTSGLAALLVLVPVMLALFRKPARGGLFLP